MTTTVSVSSSVPSPLTPDYRAGAIVEDLVRPVPDARASGVLSTLFMAVPTLGLLPAVVWPLRWNAFAAAEREHYQRAAEWVRANVRHPDVPQVCARAAAIRPSRLLSVLPLVCAGAVCLLFLAAFLLLGANATPAHLLEWTYHYFPAGRRASLLAGSGDVRPLLFWVWTEALSLAYFCHWLQVHLHARRVRCFLDEFNKIAIHEALAPVFLPPVGFGLRPLYTLAAILLVPLSALWGVPMMLAGAVQRSYVRSAGRSMRTLLARRVADLMLLYRHPAAAPPPSCATTGATPTAPAAPTGARQERCPTAGCLRALPPGARFCPRCGARMRSPLDRVA